MHKLDTKKRRKEKAIMSNQRNYMDKAAAIGSIGQTTRGLSVTTSAASQPQPPSIVEHIMIRISNNNDRLGQALQNLRNINDRFLGQMDSKPDGSPMPEVTGMLSSLERSAMVTEHLTDCIYEQIQRLESI